MAAIGRFQKGEDIFYAKVVDGKLYKLKGDVFGSPSYVKRPIKPTRGIRTLVPVQPSKVIAVGLNYADHARESKLKPPQQPLFWLKAPTALNYIVSAVTKSTRIGLSNLSFYDLMVAE